MIWQTPSSKLTYTLIPHTALIRSKGKSARDRFGAAEKPPVALSGKTQGANEMQCRWGCKCKWGRHCCRPHSHQRVVFFSGEPSSSAWRPMSSPPTNRSEEHTSELQYLMHISYAVFSLKKNKH